MEPRLANKYGRWGASSRFNRLMNRIPVYHNILKRKIDNLSSASRLFSVPYVIQIEPTTKCNLKCSFCESGFWDRKGIDMPISIFKKIIDQFPSITKMHLQGFGEPLMCKDFFKMIDYCKFKGITVTTTTNATLLNEKNIQEIFETGLDSLSISIDGATPETFESIRIGAKFDEVIKNTKNIIRIRGRWNKPQINFSYTATNENIHEFPDILKLAKDIGIDLIYARLVCSLNDDNVRKKISEVTLQKNDEKSINYINRTMEESKKIGLPIIWLTHKATDHILCKDIFESCYVTVDGFVTPCVNVPDPRKFNFGNLLEQNFNEIWNNSQYILLREEYKAGKMPQFCKDCPMG